MVHARQKTMQCPETKGLRDGHKQIPLWGWQVRSQKEMSTIHFRLELLGCQKRGKVIFRMIASFYFKILFYNRKSGTRGHASKSWVPSGILNIRPNEKLIGVSQSNSKYTHCSFKARGKI